MPRGLAEVDGEALRAGREQAELSITDVWRRTGIAPDTLSRIEDGRPEHVRPRTLERLAKAIGVEPERLRKEAG